MPLTDLQPAFVLHARPYRETSLIVELLTENHGRIAAVARSARGPRSRFKNLLQPFTPLMITWRGNNELVSLTKAEPNGPTILLIGKALLSGMYLNELLVKCLHRFDAHPNLFCDYQASIQQLTSQALAPTLRIFEKRLLSYIGYGLQLDHEAFSGRAIDPDHYYCWDPKRGIVPYTRAQVGYVYLGKNLLALHKEDLQPDDLKPAKILLRTALQSCLGSKKIWCRLLFASKKSPSL